MLFLWKDKYEIDQIIIEKDARVFFNAIMEEIISKAENSEQMR